MAFFKFRKNSPSAQGTPSTLGESAAPAETLESLRRRALYRLIGAAVLVVIAIIVFSILFDRQPRPVSVQAPIIIPDRNTAPPLSLPASAAAAHSATAPVRPASAEVPASASLAAGEEALPATGDKSTSSSTPLTAGGAIGSAPPTQPDANAKQQAAKQQAEKEQAAKQAAEKRKADEQAQQRQREQADAARARALLDGKSVSPVASSAPAQGGRYMVQIGAFKNPQSAQSARQTAENAGIKTSTQVVNTSAGPRTRVRVGPFASRDEAVRALDKLKQAGLGGSIVAP